MFGKVTFIVMIRAYFCLYLRLLIFLFYCLYMRLEGVFIKVILIKNIISSLLFIHLFMYEIVE
jgi:hypothetical protein